MLDATVRGTGDGEVELISPEAANSLAERLLGELRTRMGGLQIAHARRVAAMVRESADDRIVAVALLHDVVEKGCISADELLAITRDARLVELVEILTRRDGEADESYLSRCAADPVALLVKRADLADKLFAGDSNLAPEQAARLRRRARDRLDLLDALARRRQEWMHP
jgi:(p)ppGpp synthase/HD superfamily hydrolase